MLLLPKEKAAQSFVGVPGDDYEELLMLMDIILYLLGASFKQGNDNNWICILER